MVKPARCRGWVVVAVIVKVMEVEVVVVLATIAATAEMLFWAAVLSVNVSTQYSFVR